MAAIVSTRILALQATSPRIVAVPLPTNVTVDLSNTSQALNNLPSYTRVSGVTALATQSTLANGGGYLTGFGSVSSQNSLALGGGYLTGFGSVAGQNSLAFGGAYLTGFGAVASQTSLAYGGSYLTGFGVLASQSSVNLASQITGSLANSNVSGLGALALLGSVALDGAYVVNNLAATRIGAGTLAAGVIYAGDIAASQITSGYIAAARINAGTISVGKLQGGTDALLGASGTLSYLKFGLGTQMTSGVGEAAVWGSSSNNTLSAGFFGNTSSGVNCYASIHFTASSNGTSGAGLFWGGFNVSTVTYTTAFVAGGGDTAGIAAHTASGNRVYLASGSYAIDTVGKVRIGAEFGCNGATPVGKYTVNGACSDLATCMALTNQLRAALYSCGIVQ